MVFYFFSRVRINRAYWDPRDHLTLSLHFTCKETKTQRTWSDLELDPETPKMCFNTLSSRLMAYFHRKLPFSQYHTKLRSKYYHIKSVHLAL